MAYAEGVNKGFLEQEKGAWFSIPFPLSRRWECGMASPLGLAA